MFVFEPRELPDNSETLVKNTKSGLRILMVPSPEIHMSHSYLVDESDRYRKTFFAHLLLVLYKVLFAVLYQRDVVCWTRKNLFIVMSILFVYRNGLQYLVADKDNSDCE